MPEISTVTVLSTLSGVVTASFKIAEKVFEIRAVGEQSNSLVQTINQVNEALGTAKTLRRQKSHLFSTSEKEGFDQTFTSTEEALNHVGRLVENTRVDQQVYGVGSVRFQNKMLFVLRDSPHIGISLQQLSIANQQLSTAIVRLDNRQAPRIVIAQASPSLPNNAIGEQTPPPSYEDSQMIAAIRQKSLRKRSSALSVRSYTDTADSLSIHRRHSSSTDASFCAQIAEVDVESKGANTGAGTESTNDGSATSPQQDGPYVPRQAHIQSSPAPPSLGRARSRRWLEARCR